MHHSLLKGVAKMAPKAQSSINLAFEKSIYDLTLTPWRQPTTEMMIGERKKWTVTKGVKGRTPRPIGHS